LHVSWFENKFKAFSNTKKGKRGKMEKGWDNGAASGRGGKPKNPWKPPLFDYNSPSLAGM